VNSFKRPGSGSQATGNNNNNYNAQPLASPQGPLSDNRPIEYPSGNRGDGSNYSNRRTTTSDSVPDYFHYPQRPLRPNYYQPEQPNSYEPEQHWVGTTSTRATRRPPPSNGQQPNYYNQQQQPNYNNQPQQPRPNYNQQQEPRPTNTRPQQPRPNQKINYEPVTQFAWTLFKNAITDGQNYVSCPLSPQLLLGFLVVGSEGQTQHQLASTVGYDGPEILTRIIQGMLRSGEKRELQV
jgi:hypothetical protein